MTLRSDDFAARRALWLLPFGRGLLLWEGVLCCSSELLGLSQRVAPRAVQRWAVVSLLARVSVAREADVIPAWTHTHTHAHSSGDERERSAAVLAFHSSVRVARVLLQCGVDTLVNASERNVNLRVSGGL